MLRGPSGPLAGRSGACLRTARCAEPSFRRSISIRQAAYNRRDWSAAVAAYDREVQVIPRVPGRRCDFDRCRLRKDITIELHDEAGQTVMAFQVFRCWPSEYVALSELHANADSVAFESLKLEHEGWQRDQAVVEPKEPSLSEPP